MILSTLALRCKSITGRRIGCLPFWNLAFYHQADELGSEELLPSEWYRAAAAKIIRLTYVLKDVKQIDGRIISINDSSVITDDCIISHMETFKSLAKAFIEPTTLQLSQRKTNALAAPLVFPKLFSRASERSSTMLISLTQVCNFLNVSAQKRKHVRLALCPQVTQHHIWWGVLEEVLRDLKHEMDCLALHSNAFEMGEQILFSCIKFLTDIKGSSASSPSWMRPAPLNKVEKPLPSRKWEEVLDMFVDLSKVLGQEQNLTYHLSKLDIMKEGLYQIKDLLVERDISHKEVRRQDYLVQKKLTKSLGHSSKCLFTLLLYYLHGTIRDIEIELNRALSVYQLVWQTAAMDGVLELQGHLWCPEAEERSLTYRGNVYYIHRLGYDLWK
ncbi:hypothetical protein MUK42_09694 [Musa troglodytarum]|uniref:Uncharacterized protein n=1 Tax=Musa troglodytarum TaxID=320322 RepID=A0A9E7JB62_9LILI|nr:hypothetical protein MUK42_09694 [Musa troglodytarum]URD74579.1 hypothetical protein MUK42_09694 [Musa troglodytarum]URD74580.1 hypothetical protein MUK42_09694 [Musa troglodytarum]